MIDGVVCTAAHLQDCMFERDATWSSMEKIIGMGREKADVLMGGWTYVPLWRVYGYVELWSAL